MTFPFPDSSDLRVGVPVHDSLLALLPLVGIWQGTGTGVVDSTGAQFRYRQHVTFSHDGRPFLVYEARSWLVDDDDQLIRPAWRESGFWRSGSGPDDVEAVISANTGQSLLYLGSAGDLRWELGTVSAVPTPTARTVGGERRLYAVLGDDLVYATELAPAGRPYAPHLNARLSRVTP